MLDFAKLNTIKPYIKPAEYASKADMYCRFCNAPTPKEITEIISNYNTKSKEIADYFFSLLPESFQEYTKSESLTYRIYTGCISGEHMALSLRFNVTCSSEIQFDYEGNMHICLSNWRNDNIPTEGLIIDKYLMSEIYYKFDK